MKELIAAMAAVAILSGGGDGSDIWEYSPDPAGWVEATVQTVTPTKDCLVAQVSWPSAEGPLIEDVRYLGDLTPEQLRYELVGTYFWTQWDQPQADSLNNVESLRLAVGTTKVEVCR